MGSLVRDILLIDLTYMSVCMCVLEFYSTLYLLDLLHAQSVRLWSFSLTFHTYICFPFYLKFLFHFSKPGIVVSNVEPANEIGARDLNRPSDAMDSQAPTDQLSELTSPFSGDEEHSVSAIKVEEESLSEKNRVDDMNGNKFEIVKEHPTILPSEDGMIHKPTIF